MSSLLCSCGLLVTTAACNDCCGGPVTEFCVALSARACAWPSPRHQGLFGMYMQGHSCAFKCRAVSALQAPSSKTKRTKASVLLVRLDTAAIQHTLGIYAALLQCMQATGKPRLLIQVAYAASCCLHLQLLGGWTVVAILCASMSTATGAILATSTVMAHNIFRKVCNLRYCLMLHDLVDLLISACRPCCCDRINTVRSAHRA